LSFINSESLLAVKLMPPEEAEHTD